MKQYATVKKILDGGRAVVSVVRESSCGKNCASCGGCSEKKKEVDATAVNLCDAGEGDFVCLETPTSEIIRLVCVTYLLPILFMLFFCIIANSLGASEGIVILCGGVGLVASFLITRWVDGFVARKGIKFNIVSVIKSKS